MSPAMQLYPPLDAATEAALRASIERFGVLVPVVVSQHGEILDGHHRSRLAGEMGVSFDSRVVPVADLAEAREVARTLNEDRRMLTREQRLPVVVALKQDGHSNVAIGNALGVSEGTVRLDLKSEQVRSATNLPQRVTGIDGKTYPSSQPRDEPQPTGSRPRKATAHLPYEPTSERQHLRAKGQLDRIAEGLAEVNGICRGLRDVDFGMAVAAADQETISTLAARAADLSRSLRDVKTRLEEARDRKAA